METTAKTQGISWGCRVPFDFIWDSSSHIMCVKRFQSAFYVGVGGNPEFVTLYME